MGKILVCRCEDVLLSEIEEALRLGSRDIESIKRYTGFGTGVCQGKSCVGHVAEILRAYEKLPNKDLMPFRTRPPLSPIPLALLSGDMSCKADNHFSSPLQTQSSGVANSDSTDSEPGADS